VRWQEQIGITSQGTCDIPQKTTEKVNVLESIVVGSKQFVEATKEQPGIKAKGRRVMGKRGMYELREPAASYKGDFGPENGVLRIENTYSWNVYP